MTRLDLGELEYTGRGFSGVASAVSGETSSLGEGVPVLPSSDGGETSMLLGLSNFPLGTCRAPSLTGVREWAAGVQEGKEG